MAVMVSSHRGRAQDATMHGVRRDVGALEGIAAVDDDVGRQELVAIDGASESHQSAVLSCHLNLPSTQFGALQEALTDKDVHSQWSMMASFVPA